jgi:hypothetical protein
MEEKKKKKNNDWNGVFNAGVYQYIFANGIFGGFRFIANTNV